MADKGFLYGTQAEALQTALMSAFFERDELDQLLYLDLDKDLSEIITHTPTGLDSVAVAVIRGAERAGWVDDLIRWAHATNPGNPALKRFHDEYAAGPRSRLSLVTRRTLRDALLSAYPSRSDLQQLLALKLNRDLDELTELPTITFAVIRQAEAEGWTDALIRKAYEARPRNADLKRFYATYTGSAQREVEREAKERGLDLERMVTSFDFVDVRTWREELQNVEGRVCRIDIPDAQAPRGTGFLVAPDVVMTNHHVLADVLEGRCSARDVVLRFDHHLFADASVSKGTEHRLASAGWLLASSPPSPLDVSVNPSSDPSPEHLDYALVRLASPAGCDQIEGRERGFLPFRAGPVEFKCDMGLVIVQHPSGRPMKLAIDPSASVFVNASRTRVRYRTNTEPGSSGSPCFTMDWKLAALHHSGDPEGNPRALYNEGIPLDTIRAHLPSAIRSALGW